jgi:phosphoribosylaminoimidazole-succinocarboxamide synthase
VVSDEIHTPDSSRYWFADTYAARFAAGQEQRKIDKEYVREWLAAQGFRGEGRPPVLPDEIRIEAARRYIQAYEQVTGKTFVPATEPLEPRIRRNLKLAGYLK